MVSSNPSVACPDFADTSFAARGSESAVASSHVQPAPSARATGRHHLLPNWPPYAQTAATRDETAP